MPESLIEIVRDVARAQEVPSSLIVSSSRRRDVEKARWLAVQEIVRRCPDVTPQEMADVFGLNLRAGRYRIAMGRIMLNEEDKFRPWPVTPAAIVREHLDRMTPEQQRLLINGARMRPVTTARRAIAIDIYRRCPGIRPVAIARLLNVDRTSILYAIGKLPNKNIRTSSAPVNPEQTRTNAA